MPRHVVSDDDEPLEDKTAALPLRNKKTERMKRKNVTRQQKRDAIVNITKLPTELILESLKYLRPRDVHNFSFVNRRFYSLVEAHANVIGDAIIAGRYSLLFKCLPTPKLLADVDPTVQALLVDPARQKQLSIHNRPYQHIQSPDPHQLCTCLTCILTWNNLGLVLDFAHWQQHLDSGTPIPIIPRGEAPEWNKELVARNARIARKAIENSLWHASILDLHLESTVRSIRRHSKNRGNKRVHVEMTEAEVATETDAFLSKHGPPSLEFPYQRDEYYMLEAYLPNRWWRKTEKYWFYTIAGQHERDLDLIQRFAKSDQLSLLNHAMASIDADNWMTDVLDYKTYMAPCSSTQSGASTRTFNYYAAIV
ncbi:F-box domain-containing protein [Pyrenophora tritici-repentis]|uniref:F-box domain-containing protein n=1 Tax=Pyrenophora tritici-repentis TaxID=45151 RepID=A0A2W1F4H4_9PLEO|nr:F-box domain-containing protein [Pyrenophora tritici-repentis]KAF7451949.1 F-box domain-containing protein [Pyrenophora tritici-repentis]KAF7574927.1 F-box domain-containing protein [Pyrenophora tritici-repentis]KAG9386306.1 F-box domain-containing protein [Pyrenophora tritici-repentis]KAI0589909.1 F-box domain-containing protein [Pyrenophora tritici-repentis]